MTSTTSPQGLNKNKAGQADLIFSLETGAARTADIGMHQGMLSWTSATEKGSSLGPVDKEAKVLPMHNLLSN